MLQGDQLKFRTFLVLDRVLAETTELATKLSRQVIHVLERVQFCPTGYSTQNCVVNL